MAFDLFEGLAKLGSRDMQWYDSLSDEDKKAASPFVLSRWMTGTSDRAQLVRINTFVNPYVFPLGQEKELLFKLLAAAATGKNKRYKWVKAPGSTKSSKLAVDVISHYYDVSDREAKLYVMNTAGEDILAMAEELGLEKDELSKLKKEIDVGSGNTEKPVSKSKNKR